MSDTPGYNLFGSNRKHENPNTLPQPQTTNPTTPPSAPPASTAGETPPQAEVKKPRKSEVKDDKPRPSRAGGGQKGVARRAATKVLELVEADTQTVELLANIVGVENDPVELATHIVTTPSRDLTALLDDITQVREADPFEASILVQTKGRNRVRQIGGVLTSLGLDLPKQLPPSDSKAAVAVASAIHRGYDTVADKLVRALDLARK